jgi:hypothetical protein
VQPSIARPSSDGEQDQCCYDGEEAVGLEIDGDVDETGFAKERCQFAANEQTAWRHFLVERRLLELGGPVFRAAVACERAHGMKTEPAFAAVLRLEGDPYRALLYLEDGADEFTRAGFGT